MARRNQLPPVANLTVTQHLLERINKIKYMYMYSFYPGHLEYEHNDRKVYLN